MVYYIYILECSNNAYYTGYTTDLLRRYQEHIKGSNKCKYTRSFPPRHIAACWRVDSELSHALHIEKFIKTLSRKQKIALIAEPLLLIQLLQKRIYDPFVIETIQPYETR